MFPFATRFAPDHRLPRSLRQRYLAHLRVEELETRTLLSYFPLTPLKANHVYGFDALPSAGTKGVNDGTGETIAIVDAHNDPKIFPDLDKFDKTFRVSSGQTLYQEYGASSTILTLHEMSSGITNNGNWGLEISLDVEWAHAIAPGAQILLVEATSGSLSDILAAVDYASSQPGVVAVSMSWGYTEFPAETSHDSHFPANNGITYVAASGDTGSVPLWPAVSPNVLSGNYSSETGWSNSYGGSGGGISSYEPKPSYQANVPQSSTQRTSPDVAYDANPNTGYYLYDSDYYYHYLGGWFQAGGTSAGAPQWAALIAIADQNRIAAGGSALSSSDTLNALYNLLSSNNTINSTYLHDISSGGPSATPAAPGYDLSTGLGSPIANQLIPYLANTTLVPSSVVVKSAPARPSASAAKAPAAVSARPAATVPTPVPVLLPSSSTVVVALIAAQTQQAQTVAPVVLSSQALPAAPVVSSSGLGSAPLASPLVPSAALQRAVDTSEQSGGGDNAALPGDNDMDDDQGTDLAPAPSLNAAADAAAVALGRARWDAPQQAAMWRQARSACFAAGAWVPAAVEIRAAPSEARAADEPGSALDPAAALAGMAVALGGYWGARTDESDRRKRQTNRI